MRDGGGQQALTIVPCAPIKDAGDGREQNVAPVERSGLVEVRQAEYRCRNAERPSQAPSRFQHVLQQPAKEEFLGDCDEEERNQQHGRGRGRWRQASVRRDEVKHKAERDHDGRKEQEFAKSDENVAGPRPKIVPHVLERANNKESVERRVDHKEFRERTQSLVGKRSAQPVELDGKTDNGEDEHVLPADFCRGGMRTTGRYVLKKRADADWDRQKDQQEDKPELFARERINKLGNDQKSRHKDAKCSVCKYPPNGVGNAECKEPIRRKDQRKRGEGARQVPDPLAEMEMPGEKPEGDQHTNAKCGCDSPRVP